MIQSQVEGKRVCGQPTTGWIDSIKKTTESTMVERTRNAID